MSSLSLGTLYLGYQDEHNVTLKMTAIDTAVLANDWSTLALTNREPLTVVSGRPEVWATDLAPGHLLLH